MTSREKALRDFAQLAAKLKDGEKSEARPCLFHLVAAFGHDPNCRGGRTDRVYEQRLHDSA